MDIRNVQRTGNMHYVYLPTAWCKRHNISSDSKVTVVTNNDGTLTFQPDIRKKKEKQISITVDEDDYEVIAKLIVACYLNPVASFNIKLEKPIDMVKFLDQKKIVSALEFVELDRGNITYESSIIVNEPDTLLKTMIKKIRNLVNVMLSNYSTELIDKYEEEVDKSKLLIDKSVIDALTYSHQSRLRAIDLHYISKIAHNLERMVDNLIFIDKTETNFLKQLQALMEKMRDLLDNGSNNLKYSKVLDFIKNVLKIKNIEVKSLKTYNKRRVKSHLNNISDLLLDWAIMDEMKEN